VRATSLYELTFGVEIQSYLTVERVKTLLTPYSAKTQTFKVQLAGQQTSSFFISALLETLSASQTKNHKNDVQ
jgi:hypothetical protein